METLRNILEAIEVTIMLFKCREDFFEVEAL